VAGLLVHVGSVAVAGAHLAALGLKGQQGGKGGDVTLGMAVALAMDVGAMGTLGLSIAYIARIRRSVSVS
jgi:hypothetical protein